jgi:hypothetical protein
MYLPFVTARRLGSRCEHTRVTVMYERQFELAGLLDGTGTYLKTV